MVGIFAPLCACLPVALVTGEVSCADGVVLTCAGAAGVACCCCICPGMTAGVVTAAAVGFGLNLSSPFHACPSKILFWSLLLRLWKTSAMTRRGAPESLCFPLVHWDGEIGVEWCEKAFLSLHVCPPDAIRSSLPAYLFCLLS